MKKKAQWLATLLTIGAVLEAIAGLGFIFDPARGALSLLGSSLDPAGVFIGRIAGAALLGLAIACWFARKAPLAVGSLGASWGLFAYNVLAGVTLAWAAAGLARGAPMAVAGVIVHGVLAIALLLVLISKES